MMTRSHNKHFIPLESNPEVFTDLIHSLGVSQTLHFEDVLTLDDPEFLPHPALALILVFPTNDAREQARASEGVEASGYGGAIEDNMVWFKQTIHNACGLYAIIHAISNGPAKNFTREYAFVTTHG
jgi:ubiquitin carboxyl-terminal hydrolase L3